MHSAGAFAGCDCCSAALKAGGGGLLSLLSHSGLRLRAAWACPGRRSSPHLFHREALRRSGHLKEKCKTGSEAAFTFFSVPARMLTMAAGVLSISPYLAFPTYVSRQNAGRRLCAWQGGEAGLGDLDCGFVCLCFVVLCYLYSSASFLLLKSGAPFSDLRLSQATRRTLDERRASPLCGVPYAYARAAYGKRGRSSSACASAPACSGRQWAFPARAGMLRGRARGRYGRAGGVDWRKRGDRRQTGKHARTRWHS